MKLKNYILKKKGRGENGPLMDGFVLDLKTHTWYGIGIDTSNYGAADGLAVGVERHSSCILGDHIFFFGGLVDQS